MNSGQLLAIAVLAGVVAVALLATHPFPRVKGRRSRSAPAGTPDQRLRRSGGVRCLSAAEILARTQQLKASGAAWEAIIPSLNPHGHAEAQDLLIRIRGPHMFLPHAGLAVIEAGCRRALARSASASGSDALREAIREASPFVD